LGKQKISSHDRGHFFIFPATKLDRCDRWTVECTGGEIEAKERKKEEEEEGRRKFTDSQTPMLCYHNTNLIRSK
jgi:hypothetical protein